MTEEKFYLSMTDGKLHGNESSRQDDSSDFVSYPSEGRIEEIYLGKDYKEAISRWQDDGGQ